VIVFGFWYGSQAVLNTRYPALAVVSTSMLPTLNVGDVIIVQGIPIDQIHANYTTGDIVVFRSQSDLDKLIVHRAVKIENRSNGYWLTTKGDNNAGPDSPFHQSYYIGKVIAKIPYVGNFALFINALGNFYFFIVIIIIIINILLSLLSGSDAEKKSTEEAPPEKRKLFGKLDIRIIYFLVLNVFLIAFIVFNLFGAFTFWQIGAEPQQDVTIRGMFPDLQYNTSFKAGYNNVSEALLTQGIFTYKIDDVVNGTVRPGVPAFSWVQASILFLLILNVWMTIKFLGLDAKLRTRLKL
jgi:signal peptidase I